MPCTGSGTWGRTPEYLSTFNKTTIAEFAERQKQIITNIASSLEDKGYLIYITCSCLKAENEEVITYFHDKHPNYTLLHQTILEGYNNYADTMYAAILKRG